MPSITDQFTPFRFAAAFRFAANFGESRSAGGVGSGSGEFSQIVAALSGPSISGFGAGLVCGRIFARSCFHCDAASAFLLAARPLLCCDDADAPAPDAVAAEPPLLTCVNPPSDVPAEESSAAPAPAGAATSGAAAGAAASAGAASADSSAAGAASSAAGAASDDASVVVVLDSIAESSWIEAENLLPATAANDAPAKNTSVK